MGKTSMRNRTGRPVAREAERPSAAGSIADRDPAVPATRIHDRIPGVWLDQLLTAVVDLPLFAGEDAVVNAAVQAVADILPDCAVGICFVPQSAGTIREQTVVKRLPKGTVETPAGIDPTRVFPGLAEEYVVPVRALTGATLHVASNESELSSESSQVARFVDRAAVVVGRAIANARMITSLDQRSPRAFEQRMLQADKLANFGQIAASLVHELNNPLTSIVAYSGYLIRKGAAGASTDASTDDVERLRRISESANRMLRFTRDLVSYARPSSSIAGPVVLHDVVDQAIAFCEHVLSEAGVRVERRYAPDVLTVRAVGEQLVQVFVNLLTNASQAAAPLEGRVIITTSLADLGLGKRQVVVVVVEDNGVGIAPEHLPHVFVPFFTTKRNAQGTGLGLSIVKSIVDNHDGAIGVDSEFGSGTRFVIELPVRG